MLPKSIIFRGRAVAFGEDELRSFRLDMDAVGLSQRKKAPAWESACE